MCIMPLKMGLNLVIRKARPPDDSRGGEEIAERRPGQSGLGSSPGQREYLPKIVHEVKAAFRRAPEDRVCPDRPSHKEDCQHDDRWPHVSHSFDPTTRARNKR